VVASDPTATIKSVSLVQDQGPGTSYNDNLIFDGTVFSNPEDWSGRSSAGRGAPPRQVAETASAADQALPCCGYAARDVNRAAKFIARNGAGAKSTLEVKHHVRIVGDVIRRRSWACRAVDNTGGVNR
jgi:hypothetical protein